TRANGSANTVTAPRKETPCFLRLDAAFFGSHINSISVILLVADSKGSGPLLFAGLAGLAKAEPNQNRRGFRGPSLGQSVWLDWRPRVASGRPRGSAMSTQTRRRVAKRVSPKFRSSSWTRVYTSCGTSWVEANDSAFRRRRVHQLEGALAAKH